MQTHPPLVSSQVQAPLVVAGAAWVTWMTLLALLRRRASGRGLRETNVTAALVVLLRRRHVHIPSRMARAVLATPGQLHLPTQLCTMLLLAHRTINPTCLLTAMPTTHHIILRTLHHHHRTVLSLYLPSGMVLILRTIRNLHRMLQTLQAHPIPRFIPRLPHHLHHLP